jgi:hypothetical protein
MQLTLVKTGYGFIAADDDTAKSAARLPIGTMLTRDWIKVRNGKHHRLRFRWIPEIFAAIEHLGMFANSEALRCYLTLQTDYVLTVMNPATGEIYRTPRSWSYKGMDETDFSKMVEQITTHLCGDFASICQMKGNWSDRELQGFIAMVSL